MLFVELWTLCYLFFLLFTRAGKHWSTPALGLCSTAEIGRPGRLVPSRKKKSPVLQTPDALVSSTLVSCTSTPLHMLLPKSLQYPCIS